MRTHVRLDLRGLEEVARSRQVGDAIEEAAEAVAANVRAINVDVEHVPGDVDLPVEVGDYNASEKTALVTIAHPSGLAVQAKHGALTKAAGEAGLDVRGG